MPSTTPTPATAGPVRPRPGVNAGIVDRARSGGRAASLTFDDGPNPADTLRLLDVLRRHRVAAVFCLWGEHVDAHPGVVRRIVADGHTLCNHGMRHDDMGAWPPERIAADLAETNEAIRRAVPHARVRYFRAPYGAWGRTPAVAAALGMQPLGWRLSVGDWEPPGTDELVRRLLDGITPGAVVLLHDGGGDRSQTVEAVDRVVPVLRAQRWRFTLPRKHA
ncbi:polysaccharide deacetylase family protein [Micromonospora echinofusca]|uniref:Polysaccharide deacetylase family protein n=1 Tax=Micromonospora echinofusca TaxID=47858 RepID=A0ABS3VLJ0_MICEH|nr:polysaccharide deacetylase family protein [Micromonospora echinofusca]MBO4205331.1 polysaccharide deacetylase family protein [Micromonospora echinofusca]